MEDWPADVGLAGLSSCGNPCRLREEGAAGGEGGEGRGEGHHDAVEGDSVDHRWSGLLCGLEGASGGCDDCQHDRGHGDDPIELRREESCHFVSSCILVR